MSTFMQLVNESIDEAKVTLDPLTAANFASPPRTHMYSRFKRWINRSYRELMETRKEWFFRSERGVVTVWPRLALSALTYTPVVGDTLVTEHSDVTLTVVAVHTFEDVETDAIPEITISYSLEDYSDSSKLVLNERLSKTNGTAQPLFGRIKGRGRYNFLTNSVGDIDPHTISFQPAVDYTDDPTPTSLNPLGVARFRPYDRWAGIYDGFTNHIGRPTYITQAPDGNYEVFPVLDGPYDVTFTYSQVYSDMVLHSDTPLLLPAKYHDYLMWCAVAEFADFDKQGPMYARAKKHIDKYMFWMTRDRMPPPGVDLYRFDG